MARSRKATPQRPVVALFDVLGKRWTLRVLWELRQDAFTFRGLQAACADVSPSVLNTRLRDLRDLGVVERTDEGYALTKAGRSLGGILMQLSDWAKHHA